MPLVDKKKTDNRNSYVFLSTLRKGLFFLILIYFSVGMASFLTAKKEIFPFFSWSLFSVVPNPSPHYEIIIHQHNGKKLASPKSLYEAPSSIVNRSSAGAKFVIRDLGKAYLEDNKEEVIRLRTLLEKNFLKGNIKYELVSQVYDPIKRWKNGETQTNSLGFFITGEFE